jgi:DNA replication protein DnaC
MSDFKKFWQTARYKDACLSKLQLPDNIAQTLHDWVKKDKHLLFFAGNPGVGKSYFCAAYIHRLQSLGQPFRYFSEHEFFGHLREIIQKGWDYEWAIRDLCQTKYLILDDIGTARDEKLSDFQKEALHILIDIRYNEMLPTLITSNWFLDKIEENISKKFASRIRSKDNTIIELNWIDKRQE